MNYDILYAKRYISSCTTLGIGVTRGLGAPQESQTGLGLGSVLGFRVWPLGAGIFKRMKILIVVLKPLGQILLLVL